MESKYTFHRFHDPYESGGLTDTERASVANAVAGYTQSPLGVEAKMLPMQPADVFAKQLAVVALGPERRFASYAAATQPVKHNNELVAEVGTLMTPNPADGGRGLAHKAVFQVTEALVYGDTPDGSKQNAIAFANNNSQRTFEDNDYTVVEGGDAELIPEEYKEACRTDCKLYEFLGEQACCDTIMYRSIEDESILHPDTGTDETAD